MDIKSLIISSGNAGRDYIRLDLNTAFPGGITEGKLIIDDYEYGFNDVPGNLNLKLGNLTIMNKKTFKFFLKKQSLDLFNSVDGLWVELQIDGTTYRKELEHRELGVSQTWKSVAFTTGTNMNVSRLTGTYRLARFRSLFRVTMTGTGMDAFSETPTASFDDADWELTPPVDLNGRSIYKGTSPTRYMLKIDPAKDKWNMTLMQKDVNTGSDHFNEDSKTVTVSITDGTDTATIDVPCKVKQRIQYKK